MKQLRRAWYRIAPYRLSPQSLIPDYAICQSLMVAGWDYPCYFAWRKAFKWRFVSVAAQPSMFRLRPTRIELYAPTVSEIAQDFDRRGFLVAMGAEQISDPNRMAQEWLQFMTGWDDE